MAQPSRSIAHLLTTLTVGLLAQSCGGAPEAPGGDCESICRQVATVCGGNTGQVGLAPGGCTGVCALVPGGAPMLTPCTTAATSCEAAQACFSGARLADGGMIFPTVDGGGPPRRDGGPPPADSGCGGEMVVGSTQVVPNVHLVLDQSGSMSMQDFGPNNEERLSALQRVMKSVVGNPDLAGKIRWGLTTFPQGADDTADMNCILSCNPFDINAFQMCADACDAMYGGCMPPTSGPNVAPDDNTVAAVQAGIDAMSPQGSTPSAETLTAAKGYLTSVTTPDHPTYVLFGTDGEPTCSDDGQGSKTIAAAMALATAGIKVFVVGISSSVAGSTVLDQVAIAGGAPRNANPRFYPAENDDELTQALGEITSAVASCTFRLDMPAPNPLVVSVYVNSMSVPRNDPNGFTYTFMNGGAAITLNGTACQTFQAGGTTASVQVRFGCGQQG
jgi:hypothetical protein